MRENTRRWLCRIAFVVLCLGPTTCTCALIAYRVSPLAATVEKNRWQRILYEQFGLVADIGEVAYPRGGVVLLKKLALNDPDSQRRIGHVRMVEMARTDHGLVVLLSQPEVEARQFVRLCEVLHERVLRGRGPAGAVQLSVAELTVHAEPESLTFTNVHCAVEPSASETEALVDFRVAGVPMSSAAQLKIIRNRQVFPPATHWRLRTGPTPLPCSLFADYVPALERLGRACQFQGTVSTEPAKKGWTGEMAGRFHQVELERLIEPFPHKLSGAADVVVNHARFREGRLHDASGSIRCSGGVISSSLIATFGEAFDLQIEPREEDQGKPLGEYKQLAVGFQLDAAGIKVSGLCEGAAQGTLLEDRTGPLARDTQAEAVPAVALARALSPADELQVPATLEADLLLRTLPLPETSTPATLTAERLHVPLRLK